MRYEDHIRERRASSESENTTPEPSVHNFLVKKGYMPRVLGVLPFHEIIYIGEDIDTAPMLADLRRVSGVIDAGLLPLYKVSNMILSSGPDPEGGVKVNGNRQVSVALIEVGKMSNGLLYELGSVIVRYHNRVQEVPGAAVPADRASSKAVSEFFTERGYNPEKRLIQPYVEVVHIDPCADIASLLDELKTVPGVADAQLDIIHTTHYVLAEEPKILGDLKW